MLPAIRHMPVHVFFLDANLGLNRCYKLSYNMNRDPRLAYRRAIFNRDLAIAITPARNPDCDCSCTQHLGAKESNTIYQFEWFNS